MAHFEPLTRVNGEMVYINPENVVAILNGGAESAVIITTAGMSDTPYMIHVSNSVEQAVHALSV